MHQTSNVRTDSRGKQKHAIGKRDSQTKDVTKGIYTAEEKSFKFGSEKSISEVGHGASNN